MRSISSELIVEKVCELAEKTLLTVDRDVIAKLKECKQQEKNELALWALDTILKNDEVSLATNAYPCQDTGLAVVFVRLGNEVVISGKTLTDAINEGVRLAYSEARKSVLDPLTRINTKDNTPAVIYTDIVPGDILEISFLAKGAGSENMSRIYMLTPSKGRQGIIDCVTSCVKAAGSNPCPPILLGVGIGGTMDKAAVLSKEALIYDRSCDQTINKLEEDILTAVNALGIGAQGFGGSSTCISARVRTFPTHIGMLPVAVTVQCHSARHNRILL